MGGVSLPPLSHTLSEAGGRASVRACVRACDMGHAKKDVAYHRNDPPMILLHGKAEGCVWAGASSPSTLGYKSRTCQNRWMMSSFLPLELGTIFFFSELGQQSFAASCHFTRLRHGPLAVHAPEFRDRRTFYAMWVAAGEIISWITGFYLALCEDNSTGQWGAIRSCGNESSN